MNDRKLLFKNFVVVSLFFFPIVAISILFPKIVNEWEWEWKRQMNEKSKGATNEMKRNESSSVSF